MKILEKHTYQAERIGAFQSIEDNFLVLRTFREEQNNMGTQFFPDNYIVSLK